MPGAERAQHRQQRGRPVEQLQGAADHAHEALALVRHVALEQRAQRRIGTEEVVVEQRCGVARDRLDQGEAAAHEADLLYVHGRLPQSEGESLRTPCRSRISRRLRRCFVCSRVAPDAAGDQ
jgi:hypothetical protein